MTRSTSSVPERSRVRVDLDRNAITYYDEGAQTWRVDPGRFRVSVGASSRDIRATETVALTDGTTYGGGTSVADGRLIG